MASQSFTDIRRFFRRLISVLPKLFALPPSAPVPPPKNALNLFTLQKAIELQDIVALTDAAGRILEVNENFCQISRYQRDELIGQTHAILNSGYHPKSFYKDLYKTIYAGHPWKGIFCNKAKDGSLYWVDSIIYPQLNSAGEIEGFLAVRHNITEQVNLLETSAMVQKRMELLLEHIPLGVVEINPDFNIQQLNPAFAKILGYSYTSLLGKNLFNFTHPDNLEMSEESQKLQLKMIENHPHEMRVRFLHKDGSAIWGRVTIKRLPNGHHITTIENIQPMVDQEDAIKSHTDQLKNVYALSKDIIGITNFDGRLLFANRAYEEITGFSMAQLKTQLLPEKFHPDDLEEVRVNYHKLLNGLSVTFEARIKTQSNGYRLIHWNTVPNLNEKIFYSIGRDITQTRKDELKLMTASKMASLSQVASGVAHEINNPLAIIRGRIELIKKQINSPSPNLDKINHSLTNADEMVTRIASIVEALRIFSSPSGSMNYLEELLAETLLERTISFFLERLQKKNVQHIIELQNGDFHFLARSRELTHALSMLIANSLDAVEEQQDNPWLKISASKFEHTIEIKVQDSGKGIPLEIRGKIMEPFFTTKPQSMGLGLSIASGLIAGHGGSLRIDESEIYTTFVISLPIPKKNSFTLEERKIS